jgi:hypothetical protein
MAKKKLHPRVSAGKIRHGHGVGSLLDIHGLNKWIFQLLAFNEYKCQFNTTCARTR